MFTSFDKAAAPAIAAAVTKLLDVITTLPGDVTGAVRVLLAMGLVWLIPNKAAAGG